MEEGSELKDELGVLWSHVQRFFVEELRPWAEFFGPVSAPNWTQMEVKKRVGINLSFFATNYIIICAICSAFYVLRSPGLLMTLLLSVCMFLYVFMSRRKVLVVMDVTLGTREKTVAAALGSLVLLSLTGYIFSLQWSGIIGATVCTLHATFRPPVARAIRAAARNGGSGANGIENPELHGADGDLEGGSGAIVGRGRPGPVNANIRLRTRPTGGGMGGMVPPPGGGPFRDGGVPMVDPMAAAGGLKQHAHGS